MRKLLSLFLVLCMLISIAPTALAADFMAEDATDLSQAFYYEDSSGADTTVNVTITNSIDMGGNPLTARDGYTYNVTSSESGNGDISTEGASAVGAYATDGAVSAGSGEREAPGILLENNDDLSVEEMLDFGITIDSGFKLDEGESLYRLAELAK